MKLVDVHCHLESTAFSGSLDSIINDARSAGIIKLITNAITPLQWQQSRHLAITYECVEYAMGIHPWYIEDEYISSIASLSTSKEDGAVAIGEIGLDRKIEAPVFDKQLLFFEKQLAIACGINLPVIIHCRGAFNDLITSIKKIGMPDAGGVIHSFSGSTEIALELIRYNLSFSLGGILTYRNSKKRKAMLEAIYPDHFLLETDSPDIPPVERRGEKNVPANIIYNLRAAAEILDITEEKIADTTTENAKRIFNLDI